MLQSMLAQLKALYKNAEEQIVADYFAFLRFPSISANPAHHEDARNCAAWVQNYLQSSGIAAKLIDTPGLPFVYGEWLNAGKDKPTVLVYGHYDVQPVDPLELWHNPPFEPTLRNGKVYARGAQDNKGQIFYTLAALRALLQHTSSLPVNIKLCIEGEEETSSRSLFAVLPNHAKLLTADFLIAPDFEVGSLEQPAITAGMRGLLGLTIELQGSKTDLHSGRHGGLVYNPNHALVSMLAALRDDSGRITVPHFYDSVVAPGPKERQQLDLTLDISAYEAAFGTKANGGESDYSPEESAVLRPTLEINGIGGGYAGPGMKTVIPARARATLSCRLVPKQDPEAIFKSIRRFLEEHTPKGMQIKIEHFGGAPALRTSPAGRGNQALTAVYRELFDKEARFVLSGATVPITGELARVSGAEPILMGMGLASDDIHAPNEHFDLERLKIGFLAMGRLLQQLGAAS